MTQPDVATKGRVLVVDDDASLAEMLTIVLRQEGFESRMCTRGNEALGQFREFRPDVVLLDLNLPKKDGREVLQEIKGDPALRTIPVVILTSSEAERDIAGAYALQANCYITKPVDLDQFITVVRSIEDFWFSIVKLPPEPHG